MQPETTNIANLERVYRELGSALLLFGMAVSGDRDRAQDALQQVFLKLMQNTSLLPASGQKAYLFASVRNALLNEAKVRHRHVELDAGVAWFDPPDRDYAVEKRLQGALLGLPAEQRNVLILHVWGELTFAETAAVLDVSANTVASRYRYALAKLREEMSVKENSPC